MNKGVDIDSFIHFIKKEEFDLSRFPPLPFHSFALLVQLFEMKHQSLILLKIIQYQHLTLLAR
jgi:hypothetical protein